MDRKTKKMNDQKSSRELKAGLVSHVWDSMLISDSLCSAKYEFEKPANRGLKPTTPKLYLESRSKISNSQNNISNWVIKIMVL